MILHKQLLTECTVSGSRFDATHQYAEIQRQYNMYKRVIDNYEIDVILEIESSPVPSTNDIKYKVLAKSTDKTQLAMIRMLISETV